MTPVVTDTAAIETVDSGLLLEVPPGVTVAPVRTATAAALIVPDFVGGMPLG